MSRVLADPVRHSKTVTETEEMPRKLHKREFILVKGVRTGDYWVNPFQVKVLWEDEGDGDDIDVSN